MAGHQHDAERVRVILERGLAMTTILLAPISAFMFVNAEDIVLVLLGSQWTQTVPVFQVLAIFTIFRTGYMIFGTYFRSMGKLAITIQHSTVFAVLVVGLSSYSVSYGPVGVAWGAGVAVAVHFLLLCIRASHHAKLALETVASTFGRGLLYVVFFGAAAWLGTVALDPLDPAVRLIILSAIIGALGLAMLAWAPRWTLGKHGVWFRHELHELIFSKVRRRGKKSQGA
jgi:O-antigen/teichoic acid export membrane protein